MRTLLITIFLAISLVTFGQSPDGLFKTLTASGTDTYTVSDPQLPSDYSSKEKFIVHFTNTNTGAATLNRNGIGAKAIVKVGNVALEAGDIPAGSRWLVSYNGTAYQLIGGAGGDVEWGDLGGTLSNQTDLQTALNAKQATLISGTNIKSLESTSLLGSGNIDLAKGDVGLGNVDNTSDANKPVSTATQTALDLKMQALSITAEKTGNYSAAANEMVPVNTTSGNVTVTFPTAPADKTLIAVKHVVRGGTNTITLTLGGSDKFNVAGGSASGTLTLANQAILCQYKASTALWYVIADDLSLAQLDLRFAPISAAYSVASFVESLAGSDNTKVMTPLRTRSVTERVYNVEAYGALHDYQTVSNASITSGTPNLTVASAAFTSADVGKTIRLFGAGAAGVDLITTISAFVSSTAVTIGTNASTTITTKQIEWGTDDTPFIQAAINAVYAAGGGTVYFPRGVYLIAGSLVTSLDGVNPNCQIYIPLSAVAATTFPVVKLLGEIAPNPLLSGLAATGVTKVMTGTILKSIIVGTGTLPSVIGQSFVDTTIDFNLTGVIVENIAIQVKTKTGTAHGVPLMSGFNFKTQTWVSLNNNGAFTESDPFSESVEPTTTCYGFILPQHAEAQAFATSYGQNTAVGFNTGFRIEEHEVVGRLLAITCQNAFELTTASGSHPTIGNGTLIAHWCKYDLKVTGPVTVNFVYYTEEYGAGKWYQNTANLYVPSTVRIDGNIRYNVIVAGGTHQTLSTSGAYTGGLQLYDMYDNSTLLTTAADVSQRTFVNTTAGVSQWWVNRDPVTGTFFNTGKAAAAVQLIGSSAQGEVWMSTSPTNNTIPLLRAVVDKDGYFILGRNSVAAGTLRFLEDTDNGSNYTEITVGAQAGNITLTLPPAVPTVTGQVLTSTTAGVMSWAAAGIDATAGDAATVNTLAGRFRKDTSGSTFTLTNSFITANSIITLTIGTTGITTGFDLAVVPGSGSAVITFQTAGVAAAPSASVDVNFHVQN